MYDEAVTASDHRPPVTSSAPSARLPLVVYVLAVGTFLMLTSEFVVAGILPEIAGDLQVSLARAGSLITAFALGMILGAPLMAMLTMRLSKRLTLILALVVFVVGHVAVALASDFAVLMAARFVAAFASGAFWAVSAVVAMQAAGPSRGSRAVGVVGAGVSVATLLGVPLGAFVAQVVGWRGTFWSLAIAAVLAAVLVARLVPRDEPSCHPSTFGAELAGLRSVRLWLVLAACFVTCGGVLATYSFIAPILTELAGVSTSLVPLVLTGFGVGSLIGTVLAGRWGDAHPHLVTIVTPAVTTILLLAISTLSGSSWLMIALVVLLGLFGLSANGVLIHLAVRFAGQAATLGSALSVASFNAGTAVGTAIAGAALTSPLGLRGPASVGTVIVALTLVPLPRWRWSPTTRSRWSTDVAEQRRPARTHPEPRHPPDSNRKRELLMRAALMYQAGDVRVEDVPDCQIKQPTDALVRITASCICGSDLHPYHSMGSSNGPARMGHKFIGIVEEVGSEVTTVKKGDLVVAPFAISDNTCEFCRVGLHTSCSHPEATFWDGVPDEGGEAEAIRVPLADGTLVKLPVAPDSALIPSLLTLSDVFGTGYHAAHAAAVTTGQRVAVVGDGAVGLMAVLSAKRLGAEQIILMGRHTDRTDLGREFGATEIVADRGEEGITKVRELTDGHGVHAVLEAVGHMPAYEQAFGIVRPGGVISRVGVPQYEDAPVGFGSLFGPNIRLAGGPAPVRAYIEELMPDVLDGSIEPGKVFDATTDIDGVPAGYQDMDDRKSLKVLIKP